MELKLNNMLEVGEIISALEARIAFNTEHNIELAVQADMNIYNQFKKRYHEFYPFKY